MTTTISPEIARRIGVITASMVLLVCLTDVLAQDRSPAGGAVRINSNLAIRQVVMRFSDGWNRHDAAAMCAPLADDVQWTDWRGEAFHTRQEVQAEYAMLFADPYKSTHRTDDARSIIYLRPDLASVDDYWTMSGAKAPDGSDWPYRAGYINFLIERRGVVWVIIASHTADFNARAPTK